MSKNAAPLSIFNGRDLWKDLIHFDLEERATTKGNFITYKDIDATLYDALQQTCSRFPNKVAIVDDDLQSYTYAELLRLVDGFAQFLVSNIKLIRGSHIGCLLYNSIEFSVAFLAALKIGAIFVPFQSKMRKSELGRVIKLSDLDCLIFDEAFSEIVETCFPDSKRRVVFNHDSQGVIFPKADQAKWIPDSSEGQSFDNALLIFTSGTTSFSKGALLTNFNIMHAIATYQKIFQISQNDSTIIATPIYYVTGLIALLGLFVTAGGTVYLHKYFDAERVLQTIKEQKITFIHASPTIFFLLLKDSTEFPELPSLRIMACGAANMPAEKIKALHKWLPKMAFRTIYGLTETSSPGTIFPTDAASSPFIGSSGLPIPGSKFKIIGKDRQILPIGEPGEVCVKGSNVLKEYYKQEVANLSQDGWLATGDIGYFNDQGYLYVVDRLKDMINRGGDKVYSFDIENELHKIPGILDAAVVGIPDPLYGETVAAMVTRSPSCHYNENDLKEMLAKRLARHEVPALIQFVDMIPVTENSKTDKKKIRAMLALKTEDPSHSMK